MSTILFKTEEDFKLIRYSGGNKGVMYKFSFQDNRFVEINKLDLHLLMEIIKKELENGKR